MRLLQTHYSWKVAGPSYAAAVKRRQVAGCVMDCDAGAADYPQSLRLVMRGPEWVLHRPGHLHRGPGGSITCLWHEVRFHVLQILTIFSSAEHASSTLEERRDVQAECPSASCIGSPSLFCCPRGGQGPGADPPQRLPDSRWRRDPSNPSVPPGEDHCCARRVTVLR